MGHIFRMPGQPLQDMLSRFDLGWAPPDERNGNFTSLIGPHTPKITKKSPIPRRERSMDNCVVRSQNYMHTSYPQLKTLSITRAMNNINKAWQEGGYAADDANPLEQLCL